MGRKRNRTKLGPGPGSQADALPGGVAQRGGPCRAFLGIVNSVCLTGVRATPDGAQGSLSAGLTGPRCWGSSQGQPHSRQAPYLTPARLSPEPLSVVVLLLPLARWVTLETQAWREGQLSSYPFQRQAHDHVSAQWKPSRAQLRMSQEPVQTPWVSGTAQGLALVPACEVSNVGHRCLPSPGLAVQSHPRLGISHSPARPHRFQGVPTRALAFPHAVSQLTLM